MLACPNFSNPEVAREFEELKQATSEKAAYAIWSLNNGYHIDKAPNGAESILFKSLLNHFNGDRRLAIKVKAKTYSSMFFNWFGDWINDPANASKVVDENGEPLVVYHGGSKSISVFRPGGQNTGSGYYTDPNTGEKIPIDSNRTIFFSSSRGVGQSYRLIYAMQQFSEMSGKISKLLDGIEDGEASIPLDIFKTLDDFYEFLTELSEFNPRFLKLSEYIKSLKNQSKRLNKREVEAYRKLLIETDKELRKYHKRWNINYASREYHLEVANKIIERYKSEVGAKSLKDGKIPEEILKEWSIFEKIKKNRAKQGLSEIANYDEAYVFLSDSYSFIYDGTDLYALTGGSYDSKKVKDMSVKEIIKFLEMADLLNKHKHTDDVYDKLQERGDLYPAFLNIRNPLIHDYEGTHQGEGYKFSKKYPFGYVAARQVDKAIKENNDGVVYENLYDPYLADNYGIFNPNQVKSIENDGSFTDGNNIYHNLKTKSPRTVSEITTLLEDILRDYFDFHRFDNTLYATKRWGTLQEKQRLMELTEGAFGFPLGTISVSRYSSKYSTPIYINKRKIEDNLVWFRNKLTHSSVKDADTKIKLVQFLHSKFPQIKGITFVTNAKWNGRFKNGIVYINANASLDIAVEECLHPFVEALYSENKPLFNQLLNEARHDFKQLRAEIAKAYSNKKFTKEDRSKELVTQALARHFSEVFEGEKLNMHGKEKSIWQKAWDWILEKLGISGVKELNKNMTLRQLAEAIFKANHISISDKYFVDERFNLSSQPETPLTRQMYDLGEQMREERELFVRNAIDSYKLANPNHKPEDLSRVRNSSKVMFDKHKGNQILRKAQYDIANTLGLHKNADGYWESDESSQRKHFLEHVINSLQQDTHDAYKVNTYGRPKYTQVGSAENVESLGNVLYSAIFNGDITTVDKQLARDYVRLFWNSSVIQGALKSIDDGTLTSQQLEDKLVDHLTRNPVESRDKNIVDWLRSMWDRINELVSKIFEGVTLTEVEKNNILKAADAAFMVAEDLELMEAESVIYDRADGNFETSTLLSDKDKEILSKMKVGLKTRLKSQQSRKVKNQRLIADIKTRLEILEGKNTENIEDLYDSIKEFLTTAVGEIGKTRNYIDQTLLLDTDINKWNPQEINFIQQDLIGYYENMLSIISDIFSDNKSLIRKYNDILAEEDPNAINLRRLTAQLQDSIRALSEIYKKEVVLPYVKKVCTDYVNKNETITDKETFIYNMMHWIDQDSNYGDINAAEVLIGMASRSSSPVVRIVEKMMSEAEYETGRTVLRKGHELIALYNKIRPTGSQISPFNYQRRFMELDKNGVPTGYFIRDINYGQFYLDKDEYEDSLRKEFGLDVDEEGNTIFPDENFTKNDSVYNKYYDKLDKWLDEHCERRYTLEYYKQKRRHLSPKTLQAQGQIQRQIDLILDKCRDNKGYINISKLTANERRTLDVLRRQKRNLGSHYNFYSDSNGILHVEEKTGDALKMADEISAWNKYLADKVKYKPNWEAYEKAKEGLSEEEKREFDRANTSYRLTPEFYELLKKVVGQGYADSELDALKKRHAEILNMLKERQGAGSQNLSKLGLGLSTDRSGWVELQRLEQKMADRKKELKARAIDNSSDGIYDFDDIAATMYVTVGDGSNKTFLNYLIDRWRNAAYTNHNLMNVFNDLFTYTDEKGTVRYLKAFTYLTARNWTININGETIKCIAALPGSEYSELDEQSQFVNDKFKKDGQSMQPKKSLYENKDYAKLTSGELEFLEAMLSIMDEANSKIPHRSTTRDYKLPQISGNTASVLANSLRLKELSTATGYMFRKLGTKYAETEDDVSTNVDLARRPDGTVVNNIPIRFVQNLKNRAVQSQDVLGSVMMFFDMAVNYENKSKNLPTLELIKYATQTGFINPEQQMSGQYKKIENMLDQRYYGKETSFGFNSNEKINKTKQRTIQTTKFIRKLTSLAKLGVNFTTIEVGYLDALLSLISDAVGGKYLTAEDFLYGQSAAMTHTFKMLGNLGNPNVKDKLVAAMQYNQLSRSNSEIFSDTHESRISKFFKQYCLMGGYTITDYMINCTFLRATYNHYRLVQNPNTGKQQFMSKSEVINNYTKIGFTESEAIDIWKNAKVTLWDAYEVSDNGTFEIVDQYKSIITKQLEDRIAGRLRDRTALYNGVIPTTEKGKIQQNIFGSFITLMRNFYVNTYWDRFHSGGDYIAEEDEHKINTWSEYRRDDIVYHNLETGEDTGAVFKDFCRGYYKLAKNVKHIFDSQEYEKLTSQQKSACFKLTSELIMIAGILYLMLWSIAFARDHDDEDDKDPAWTLELNPAAKKPGLNINTKNAENNFLGWLRWKLAVLSTRTFNERLTPWWAPTALEPLTSPTVFTSYLDDCGHIFQLGADLINSSSDDLITTGGYKGTTRITRDILKLSSPLGVDNIVRQWHTDGLKSTFNYYRGTVPSKFIIPTQEEYNEQHGLGKHKGSKNKSGKKKTPRY